MEFWLERMGLGFKSNYQFSAKSRLKVAMMSNIIEVKYALLSLQNCTFFKNKSRDIKICLRSKLVEFGDCGGPHFNSPAPSPPHEDTTKNSNFLYFLFRIFVPNSGAIADVHAFVEP